MNEKNRLELEQEVAFEAHLKSIEAKNAESKKSNEGLTPDEQVKELKVGESLFSRCYIVTLHLW